jgi:hypothetical protein
MKKALLLLPLLFALVISLKAQPYMISATNYASGFFGVIANESGQPLSVGSTVQLIWDSAGDGMDNPSLQPGSIGMPGGDDVLLGTAQIGITGGAPSAGNIVVPGACTATTGLCYLRAFHAVTPVLGTFYSESLTEYPFPPMSSPTIYGVQFPLEMRRILGNNPTVSVALTPENPPLAIGPNGGAFQYSLSINNPGQQTVNFDFWVDVVLPEGSEYGPLLQHTTLNLPPNATFMRQMTQAIPAGAPPGLYNYAAHVGYLSGGLLLDEASFPFEKTGAGGFEALPPNFTGWETTGWEGTGPLVTVAIPDVFFLAPPYPNPFNPKTQIQFGLPETAEVRIDIYNLLGSRVLSLLNRRLEAGYHTISWDAQDIASGLYFVQMKAGGYLYTEKALLLK